MDQICGADDFQRQFDVSRESLERLDSYAALLGRWGIQALTARTVADAEALAAMHRPDAILADFHLREAETGLEVLRRLCAMTGRPGALVTANAGEELTQAARQDGFEILRKPVKPAALRALLAAFARRPGAASGAGAAAVAQALDTSV